MMFSFSPLRLRWTLAACLLLAVGACSKDPNEDMKRGGLGAGAGGRLGGTSLGTAAPGSTQEFSVSVGDRVFFDTDSTDLTATAQATLDKQAQWLSQYPTYHIVVEGHADERGTREYNFGLSQRRAEVVYEYLTAKGIASTRMRTHAYGKERPVAVCNDISCWSQNRRAVTVLSQKEDF